jgi:hypothetical protein
MASTFSDLGIELMATGENAGTWGTKTNTNLQIVEKAIAGYVEQAVTSGGTTALSITDGDTTESTSVARHAVIKLTGTITGNSIVTVPDSIEKVYIVTNGTSGAYTVQFKTASGTGITFGVSEKTTRLVYSDGTNLVDAGFGGSLDLEGRELVLDADGDTTITADTDDQIDIKIAGADDFQFTANTFTAQSGSSIVVPDGGLTFGSTAITSTAAELNLLDGVSGLVQADLTKLAALDATATEINLIDGGTSAGTTAVADADGIITNDGGTMRLTTAATFKTYFQEGISTAFDDLTAGDAAVTISTTSGNITIDATANDTDIIFKGTDNSSDITMLTLDGSEAGAATFNNKVIATELDISGDVDIDGTLETDAITLNGTSFIKIEGTNFTNSLLIGHATTGTLDAAIENTGIGIGALDALTSGDDNTAVGFNAGTAVTTGLENTFIGAYSGDASTGASNWNTGVGSYSLSAVTSGDRNSSLGRRALLTVSTGGNNTSLGYESGKLITGDNNLTLGYQAGDNITSGDGNVIIGSIDADSATGDKQLIVADGTDGSVSWIKGDSSGNLIFAGDVTVGDDLNLTTDSSVINFGADSDTTLTHTDGTGLTLNSTNKLCFNDTGTHIFSNANGDLDIVADGAANDAIKLASAGGVHVEANSSSAGVGIIILDAEKDGEVYLKDGGTTYGLISENSGIVIRPTVSDTDFIIQGNDGGSTITALTLDMSDAGTATFNHDVILGNDSFVQFGDSGENILGNGTDLTINSSNDLHLTATTDINIPANVGLTFGDDGEKIEGDGTNLTVSSSGNFIIDAVSVINLDADSNGNVNLKDGGTKFGSFKSSSSDFVITSEVQDKDIIFKGDDNASAITALTLDMSDAGAATFNDKVTIGDGKLVLNSTAVTSTAAELNLLDGVSGLVQADLTKLAAVDSTAAELNIVDGGTSATSTTVADADRVVLNDNGTMVQVAMTDIKTYIGGGTSWQAVKTGDFTAAAGQGVFCNTTSAAFTLTLPAGSIGDEVSFVDYAGTFDTNNLTIASNGSEKIHGSTDNLTIAVERAANTLVFTDSTQGWLLKSK